MNILKYISHTKAILQQHLEYRSNLGGGGVLGEPRDTGDISTTRKNNR